MKPGPLVGFGQDPALCDPVEAKAEAPRRTEAPLLSGRPEGGLELQPAVGKAQFKARG